VDSIRFLVLALIGETAWLGWRLDEDPRHQLHISLAILPGVRMTAGMDDYNQRASHHLSPASIL
jgi:hypothetical protein